VIWEHLEAYTRDLVVSQGKKVFVIAGPIFDEDFGAIGPDKNIKIPAKNFKVIYILDANQTAADINSNTPTIAVIMPNILRSGKKPIEDHSELCNTSTHPFAPSITTDWKIYQTSVSEVEKESGFKLTQF
jgi:DNA/RNA endonuclease G (NUC1)